MNRDVPLLVTTAVHAAASSTLLQDPDERLAAIVQGLRGWRACARPRWLVVCDGSGADLSEQVAEVFQGTETRWEALRLRNSPEQVIARGKGYGEGEIVRYALRHSRLLRDATAFAKCTGKLWVENYRQIVDGWEAPAAFDYIGWLTFDRLDTRFYLVQRSFYERHLASCHESVSDGQGVFLEHRFCQSLRDVPQRSFLMSPTPRICGMSGTYGTAFAREGWKSAVLDVRTRLRLALLKH